jgi:hypothetical protein
MAILSYILHGRGEYVQRGGLVGDSSFWLMDHEGAMRWLAETGNMPYASIADSMRMPEDSKWRPFVEPKVALCGCEMSHRLSNVALSQFAWERRSVPPRDGGSAGTAPAHATGMPGSARRSRSSPKWRRSKSKLGHES